MKLKYYIGGLEFLLLVLIMTNFVSANLINDRQIVEFVPIVGDGFCSLHESMIGSVDCGIKKISGFVFDESTGIGINNAFVSISEEPPSYIGYTNTNTNGFFMYPLTLPIKYDFVVSADGYDVAVYDVFVNSVERLNFGVVRS